MVSYPQEQQQRNDPPPSLEDYTAFHGMFCGPNAARRCIKSIGRGTVTFIQQEGCNTATSLTASSIATAISASAATSATAREESRDDPIFYPMIVNLCLYYALVVTSLTGLCGLFRRNRLIEATEYTSIGGISDSDNENKKKNLQIP